MKVICAYCKKVILDGHESTSHGICPKCLKREIRKLEKEAQDEEKKEKICR
jgi:exosome complex RNA-binding protein Csl4